MAVELDHVFMFVSPGAPEAVALSRMGMRQAYSRRHPGQGTANACFAFDNAYLELVWAEEPAELRSEAVAPTRLAERSEWRSYRASPFGIAVRTSEPGVPLPFAAWDYAAPFLPEGQAIAVARASEDPKQPFLFRSPGGERPDQWRDFRAGARQRPIGLAEITGLHLDFAPNVEPAPAFDALARLGLLTLAASGVGPRMILTLSPTKPGPAKRLILPEMSLVE